MIQPQLSTGRRIVHTPHDDPGTAKECSGVTTREQREAFRLALTHARRELQWSQRRLAKELGVSHSTVALWERGKSLPTSANVVELEQALGVEGGTFARLLGYMPQETMRQEMLSVLDAVMADPDLGERERELLLTMYRQLVQQRRAERLGREPGEPPPRRSSDKG
jgi:transcriptional regulator with XRE-family HTH domain